LEKNITENRHLKWMILFAMSFVVFGVYFAYDSISPLKRAMEDQLGIGPTHFGWLISFYSIPNILGITLFGGILMDRKGEIYAGKLFLFFSVTGVGLIAVGGSEFFSGSLICSYMGKIIPGWSGELFLMILGRFVFGLGGEALIVAQSKIIAKWFRDSNIAFAFGINLVICRFGTIAALNVSALLLEHTKVLTLFIKNNKMGTFVNSFPQLSIVLWTAFFVMLVSSLFFVIFIILEKKGNDQVKKNKVEIPKFSLDSIKVLLKNRTFMIINILGFTFYGAIFPFTSWATDILQNKYGFSVSKAGMYASIILISTIIFTPLAGFYIDRHGKKASFMILGSFLLVISYLILGLTNFAPLLPMILLGLSFSFVPAAMWPSIPYIVKENQIATAYGLMTLFQNIGLWLFPLLIGKITEITNPEITSEMVKNGFAKWDYTYSLLMLSGLGVISLIFSLLLKKLKGLNTLK
jgi:MFS family permease